MQDNANNLFEHIRNRLANTPYIGDNNKEYDEEGNPNHSVWQQAINEDREGDVGVFQTSTEDIQYFHGVACRNTPVQIAVVCVGGDLDSAEQYLRESFNNIKTNTQSSGVYVQRATFGNIMPLGKNSVGNQMLELNMFIKYVLTE